MGASCQLILSVVVGITLNFVILGEAYEVSSLTGHATTACQGQALPAVQCSGSSIMRVHSVTVFSSPNIGDFTSSNSCPNNCNRKMTNDVDAALSKDYRFLYQWIMSKCSGLSSCDQGELLPKYTDLLDYGHNIRDNVALCPEDAQKYFAGILIDISCHVYENISTYTPPISTTQAPQTAEPQVLLYDVKFGIYMVHLSPIEKIFLGAAIGISLSVLIVVMILIYSCERIRERRKFLKFLSMEGGPTAADKNDWYVNELANESEKVGSLWTDECLRPDEIVTLDRRSLKESQQLISEDSLSVYSQNSCSTMGRGKGSTKGHNNLAFSTSTGSDTLMIPQIYVTRPCASYDSSDNLDLEQRMAAVLGFTSITKSQPADTTDSSGDETGNNNCTPGKANPIDISESCASPNNTTKELGTGLKDPDVTEPIEPETFFETVQQGKDENYQPTSIDYNLDHLNSPNVEEEIITPQHRVQTEMSPDQLDEPMEELTNKQDDASQHDSGIPDTTEESNSTTDTSDADCEELTNILHTAKSEPDRIPTVVTSHRSHSPHIWRVEVKFSKDVVHGKDVAVIGSLKETNNHTKNPHQIEPSYYKCEVIDSEDMTVDIA